MITITNKMEALCRYKTDLKAYLLSRSQIILCFFLLFLLPYLFLPMHAKGATIFKSGFETGVTLGDPVSKGGKWALYIRGSDEGYDWQMDLPGGEKGFFLTIIPNSEVFDDRAICKIVEMTGHTGKKTKALYMKNKNTGVWDSVAQRVCYLPVMDRWPLDETHIKYWAKFPADYETSMFAKDKCWNVLSEIRYNSADLRIMFQVDRNGGPLFWKIVAEDLSPGWNSKWSVTNEVIPVPIDEWFLLEIYLKARTYAQGGGAFWIKVNGLKILEKIPTASDPIMGSDGKLPSDWNILKNYTYRKNIGIYVDDFQIYDTLTPTEADQSLLPPSGLKLK